MSLVISKSNPNGARLTTRSENPVTVRAGVTLGGTTAAYGVYGTSAASWSLANLGTLIGTASGVALVAGGTVSNGLPGDTTASIHGGAYGISIDGGSGLVSNDGSISAAKAYYLNRVRGYTGTGVALASGTVVNGTGNAGATIAGASYGVRITGPAGAVVNDANIVGFSYVTSRFRSDNGVGVALLDGGQVTNGRAERPAASIVGGKVGVSISGQAGVVVNEGTIEANHSAIDVYSTYPATAVSLSSGGSVSNGAGGVRTAVISGYSCGVSISGGVGEVSNQATISGGYVFVYPPVYPNNAYVSVHGSAVSLAAGGTVVNGSAATATGARISGGGYAGVEFSGQPGLVENFGTITASYVAGFDPRYNSRGIQLLDGGTIINGSEAVANARVQGLGFGVEVSGGAGTVVNDGTIRSIYDGTAGTALLAGGRIVNGAHGVGSALIASYGTGVSISGGPGTVINDGTITGQVGVAFGTGASTATVRNSGTIVGTGGTAISFGTATARLVLEAGAAFTGAVVAGATSGNIVELVAGAAAGTLAGIGSVFRGFNELVVDSGAQWQLTGSNTVGGTLGIQLDAVAELQVNGSLSVGQVLKIGGSGLLGVGGSGDVSVDGTTATPGTVRVYSEGTIVGTGTIAAAVADNGDIRVTAGGTLALAGAVTGTGRIDISAHAVLEAGGSLGGTNSIYFLPDGGGTGGVLALAAPMQAEAELNQFAAGDTIDLLGQVATGLSFASATGILKVSGAGGTLADLHFRELSAASHFGFGSDGHGGTNIMLT